MLKFKPLGFFQSSEKELCPKALEEDKKTRIGSMINAVKDYMIKDHSFYKNKDRLYAEKGVLITNREEDSYLKGYRILYREDRKYWPSLEGVDVRLSETHKDLEMTLRTQGVAQCIVLDDGGDSQIIGPYDRYNQIYQDYKNNHMSQNSKASLLGKDNNYIPPLSETELRVRCLPLKKGSVKLRGQLML